MGIVGNLLDRNTKAFIEDNPTVTTIERRRRVAIGGGGWEWQTEEYLPPQECRLVFAGNLRDVSSLVQPDGRVVKAEATLVFLSTADVEVGDLCTIEEEQWEVTAVRTRFSKDAEIFRHAPE